MKTLISLVSAIALLVSASATFGAEKKPAPQSVDGTTKITAEQAKELFDKGTIFVDTRGDSDWEAGRIPGARHLDVKLSFTEESLGAVVGKDQGVAFYCNGERCPRSSKACAMAVGWGFANVYYFRDGFPAWQAAGYPVE